MGKLMGFLEYDRNTRPEIPPEKRIGSFEEFHLRLDEDECVKQAARCMDCGIPFCQSGVKYGSVFSGCPLHNLIPEYNDEIYNGNWKQAAERLLKTNNFPEFTGRVCPALCENACVCCLNGQPVTTHDNEYAIIEKAFEEGMIYPEPPSSRSGKRVAVIGSGPAGLAAADTLNKRGHSITVYEKADLPGGLLMYGIPNMKLDKSVIRRRVELMHAEGVEFVLNTDAGKDIPAEELENNYDAVILCCGSRKPRDVDVAGRDAGGICFAVDYLTEATKHLFEKTDEPELSARDKNVVVVGGGDTGNDCVATAIRQGCSSIVQLDRNPKAPEELSVSSWPLKANVYNLGYGQEEAKAVFGEDPRMFASTVKDIIKDENGNVKEITTVTIKKSVDENGKRIITEIAGTEKNIPCDMLILAAGFAGCEDYVTESFNVQRTRSGNIKTEAEDAYVTCRTNIFAAGDARRGPSLVVWAIAEGRACAKEVDNYLMEYSNL